MTIEQHKQRASRVKAGGSFILPSALAAARSAVAQASAADQLILRRVIAKAALD